MSRLQLPETIPTAWVMVGVLGLVFSVGIISEVLLFGGGSNGEQAVLGTSQTSTTSPTRTPRQTALPSGTAAESPAVSATPVVIAPQPAATSVAPTPAAPPPQTNPPTPAAPPPQTNPPTAIPVTPPPLAPTPPTPEPAPSETWLEVAEGFRNTQNAYYETVKTYGETTFPGAGTLPSTDQIYLTFCQVETEDSELRYWVIACSFGVLTTITAEVCLPRVGCFTPEPEYEPIGIRQFRLWWDSGEVEQL